MQIDNYSVVDIETIGDELTLDRIGFYNEECQEIFTSYDSFFEFIIKHKYLTIFAHYGGGFDFLLFLNYIRKNKKYKLERVIETSGILIYIEINYLGLIIKLHDSYAIFNPYSLNEVAKNLLGKEKLDIDRTRLQDYTIEQRNAYVMQDCILLFDSLKVFEAEIGFLDITISKIALGYFVKNFMLHKLIKYPLSFIDLIEPFYFGGHVDVYKRYGEHLNYYDINSCYGFAMREFGAIYDYLGFTNKFADKSDEKGLYNIKIDKKSKKLFAPVLPCRYGDKQNSKLYFLNSYDHVFQVTSKDLELLESLNIGYKIINGLIFKYDKDFFRDYVEFWYNKRLQSKKLKFISKKMINSLYGKFGQKARRLSTTVGENLNYYYDTDLKLGRKETVSNNIYSHAEISAWVTSCARFVHSNLIQKYQENIYYVDTDSLVLDTEMPTSNELGAVKLEQTIDRAYFIGNKFYGLFNLDHSKVVIKGYEKASDINEEIFKRAIEKNDISFSYEQNKIQKFKRSLVSANNYIKLMKISKQINDISIKRKLNDDKISTEPFQLTNNIIT